MSKTQGGLSPTQRTLKTLRNGGWHAEKVERWNGFAGVSQDLFGFVDVVAVRDGMLLMVQATSRTNHAARVRKVKASPVLPLLFDVPGVVIEVWSWGKQGARGGRKLWTLKREVVTP